MKLIGEIIGFVAIGENFLIFLSNRRERILIFKFISDVLWAANNILLGGYTGAILNVVAMGRETVFYNRDKRRWASSPIWLVVFLLVTAVSPVMSLISGKEGWYAVLPALGSMAAVIGFYSRKPTITRYVSFLANGLWLIYAIFVHNVSSIVYNIVLLTSAVTGLILAYVNRKKLEKHRVSETAEEQ
ncbi:MAG: YgjV family protein [Clostridia bacterium]|nr:YgjV family protein [Clostridia bacterium]